MPPLVGAALAFAAGVGLGAWLPRCAPLLLACAAAALAAWAAAGRGRRAGRATAACVVAVGLGGAAWLQADLAEVYGDGPRVPEGDAVVTGHVARPPERRDGATAILLERARLRAGGETFAARFPLELVVEGSADRARVGDLLTARGRSARPRGDRNLGWFPRPAQPRGRRICARLHVGSPHLVRRDGHDPGSGPGAAVLRWREAASAFWAQAPPPAAAILDALTTGERAAIPEATAEDFRRSGLSHILAISGMNVAFLAALVYFAWRRVLACAGPLARRWPVHPAAAAATLPFLWFFYRFSGSQVPVGRASAAMALAMAAVVSGRRIDVAGGCAFAALALLVADPRVLFTASFQLSFAAVAALALAGPRLRRDVARGAGRRAALGSSVRALAIASLAAGGATAPLVALHFQSVSLVGPLANLVAVPWAGFLVLPAAWAALLAAALWPAAGAALRDVAVLLAQGLVATAGFFAAPGWASVRTPRPGPLLVLALLLLVATLARPARRSASGPRLAALAGVAAALAAAAAAGHAAALRAIVLDVGQGLALAAFPPGGGVLLVDTGPRWRGDGAGRRVVVPALRRLGAARVDVLALTHAHPDHAGGAPAVLGDLRVDRVWVPGGAPGLGEEPLGSALAAHARRGGSLEALARGARRSLGSARVDVLWPPPPVQGAAAGDPNARSLGLLLSWGSGRLLVTGDAGPAEASALAGDARAGPGALLLQAPHHGASAEACRVLASSWRPALSVVASGRNGYGHPRPAALAALAAAGRVLRTDLEGAILVQQAPGGLRARTWRELSSGRRWTERLRWLAAGW